MHRWKVGIQRYDMYLLGSVRDNEFKIFTNFDSPAVPGNDSS